MAERNGRHCVRLRLRVRRTDSVCAGILAVAVHCSDARIRHHDFTRRCAAASEGAVIETAPFLVAAAPSREGV